MRQVEVFKYSRIEIANRTPIMIIPLNERNNTKRVQCTIPRDVKVNVKRSKIALKPWTT